MAGTHLARFMGRVSATVCCGVWLALSAVTPAADRPRLQVIVSIAPQAYFVERIGGDRVGVQVLVPPGQSPATYTVTASQMARLSDARVYFRIGVPFENALVPRLSGSLRQLHIVDTRRNVALRQMAGHHHHERDAGAAQAAGAMDPHTWLDPVRAITQAVTICEELADLDPAGEQQYRQNLAALGMELLSVHGELRQALRPVRGRTLMVFHPAFGYFADAYGLEQRPIEIEGKTPSARQLAGLIDLARREHVRIIFVQPQFDRRMAANVAKSIDGAVVAIDPLARDYLANLRRIATEVRRGLGDQR